MTTKLGIGEGGTTLRQMLEKSEGLLEETGYYYGLEDLALTVEAPLKMELFHSRLLAGLQAGRETTRMISASPLVREVSELCCGLYTPEGHCIAQSVGIAGHIPVMGQVATWMIRQNYEEEVGINDGDLFACNDNIIAGFHTADVCDLLPIFWEGELVAWATTVIMEAEIGAITPGTMPSSSTERFADGFHICAEKIGTDDVIGKTFQTKCRLLLRLADMFLLDRKGAVAANLKVREEVTAAIAEFGIDYFRRATRELIESERRAQLARVRTRTVPGRYRNLLCSQQMYSHMLVPPIHQKDEMVLVPIEFTVQPSGKYVFDFDGTGPWGWWPTICTPSALLGGLSVTLVQSIAYTGKANTGTVLACELVIPYDTLLWPSNQYVSTNLTWTIMVTTYGTWMSSQSRAFFSRGFREEIMLGSVGGGALEFGGKSQLGTEPFGFLMTEGPGTGGSGACGIRDGNDNGFVLFTPESDAGNCEIWELVLPVVWLGRKMAPDSCGHGKYRSGLSIHSTYMLFRTPEVFVGIPPGCLAHIPMNTGILGGYPNVHIFNSYIKNPNLPELIEQRMPLIHERGDPRNPDIKTKVSGEFGGFWGSSATVFDEVMKHGDIIQTYVHGSGGGYGDPIERDTNLIKKDLDNGVLSLEICRNVYCVEARFDPSGDQWVIDDNKTEELRKDERRRRLSKRPAKEWWHKARKRVLDRELAPILQRMYNNSLSTEEALPEPFNPIWNASNGNIRCVPKGQRWPGEFRAFWNLPEDFTF